MAKAPFQKCTIQISSKQVGASGTTYIVVLSKKTEEGVPSKLPRACPIMWARRFLVSLDMAAPPASGVADVSH